MGLQQPTNVTPSAWGELGNGTVDATKDLTVSWQVNGDTMMTAFNITIYDNDTASTVKYTTGQIADNCPFAGKDGAGNVRIFSYTIPAATLASAGITNGNNYKLTIRQFWNNSTEHVDQMSASAFITRSEPTVTLDTIPSPLSARLYDFSATYTQAEGDSLMWVRWQLALADSVDEPMEDTGNIYSTPELAFSYDGFFNDTDYAIRCQIQTQNGIQADTGWVPFTVSYTVSEATGIISTEVVKEASGIALSWSNLAYIPGVATQPYSFISSSGALSLIQLGSTEEGTVEWATVNSDAMNFAAPWTLVCRVAPNLSANATGKIVLVTASGETVISFFSQSARVARFTVTQDNTQNATGSFRSYDNVGAFRTIIMDGETISVNTDDGVLTLELSNYVVEPILSVRLEGLQAIKCLWLKSGTLSEEEKQLYLSWTVTPSFDGSTYMLADFSTESFEAGNTSDVITVEGCSIYRQEEGKQTLEFVADVPFPQNTLIDSGVASQKTYTYYMFGTGSSTFASSAIVSAPVTPCFWDWTILSCTTDEDGAYHPEGIYRFGKNLSTSAIGNNNTPNILQNFTQYPIVQLSPSNYMSGSLTSLIGAISYADGCGYRDTIDERDAIYALSTTQNTLFLKNRKGDMIEIRISDAISMATMDNTREQAQTASVSWVQIGDADEATVILTETDELYEAFCA